MNPSIRSIFKHISQFIFGAFVTVVAAMPANAQSDETEDPVIATVNGQPVHESLVTQMVSEVARTGVAIKEEMFQRIVQQLVLLEALKQEAIKRGIKDSREYKMNEALAKDQALIKTFMLKISRELRPSAEDIGAEFERLTHKQDGKIEFHARHILVDSEEKAQKLLAEAASGADFAQLAKDNTIDPGSRENGGDLGWAVAEAYVPEFAKAIQTQKIGEISSKPVKTDFGYHLVQVLDSREPSMPELQLVAPKIQQELTERRIEEFQREVLEKADVVWLLNKDDEEGSESKEEKGQPE